MEWDLIRLLDSIEFEDNELVLDPANDLAPSSIGIEPLNDPRLDPVPEPSFLKKYDQLY